MNQIGNGEAASKGEFKALVERIEAATSQIDAVYPQMIAVARTFDRELAQKLTTAMHADRELLEYVRSKVESEDAPKGMLRRLVCGLLGG